MAKASIFGTEIAVPTTAGAATSFGEATVVRVVNVSGSSATVGVATVVGQIGRFITIPTGTVQYVEKKHTEVLYASGTVRGSRVGYTG
tara:strand:- start:143 stop:406 length:264 start_codon:yes stop_codon:yes gene_type:complete